MASSKPTLRRLGSTVMYLTEATQIRQMGFKDEVQIVEALRASSGRIERALAILTAGDTKSSGIPGKHEKRKRNEDEDYVEEDADDDDDEYDKPSGSKPKPKKAKKSKKKASKKEFKKPKPKKKPTAKGEPLANMIVCVSGQMSVVRRMFWEELRKAGATIAKTVTGKVTHLITTEAEVENPTRKMMDAAKKGCHVVSEAFIRDCIERDSHLDEDKYVLYREGAASGEGVKFIKEAKKTGALAKRITDEGWAVTNSLNLMLAEKWKESVNPEGWWMSEKLDGVRAYWSGKAFYSRNGNQFPAPDWFKEKMPKTILDGELWCGRRMFRRCLSIVRNPGSDKLWEYISYLVFDAPAHKVDGVEARFEERLTFIEKTTKANDVCSCVGMVKCEGKEHLLSELSKVQGMGGEGLMLRRPKSSYVKGRSSVLLKVKSFSDEEAKVTGHQPGKGRHFGRLGALVLITPDGRSFNCGTGLSDKDRDDPPKIGEIVTYRYTELMNNGFPRFPVFVSRRNDFEWDKYCAEYQKPKALQPKKLKRQHSILYGIDAKTSPAAAKPAPAAIAAAEAAAEAEDDRGEEDGGGLDGALARELFLPPPPLEELTDAGIKAMMLGQLKHALRSFDLPVIGTREKLRQRLRAYVECENSRGGKGWDSSKVMTWLQAEAGRLGIKAETLVQIALQELDGPGFLSLTQAEIKEIGVTPFGQVKNVLRAVQELAMELS